jgi:hypothetical protein
MLESNDFSDNVIKLIYKSLSVDQEHIEAVMLLAHLESLQTYYSVSRKFPYIAKDIHYLEVIHIIKTKIRTMETHTTMQYILNDINKFDGEEIDIR